MLEKDVERYGSILAKIDYSLNDKYITHKYYKYKSDNQDVIVKISMINGEYVDMKMLSNTFSMNKLLKLLFIDLQINREHVDKVEFCNELKEYLSEDLKEIENKKMLVN